MGMYELVEGKEVVNDGQGAVHVYYTPAPARDTSATGITWRRGTMQGGCIYGRGTCAAEVCHMTSTNVGL
jgi:hypothetical protein